MLLPEHGDPVPTFWNAPWVSSCGFTHFARNGVFAQVSKGVNILHLSADRFSQLRFPLPPLEEQRRIVAKVAELLSNLDAGVVALEQVRANLKRYRAAVLKAAVEGKLTAEWRARHPATEPASQLLQRILAERRRRWEQEQLAKYAAAGKQPPKGWQAKYKEPVAPETGGRPELPTEWCWAAVGQLLIEPLCNGVSVKGSASPPGVPALRLSAMSSSGFNYRDRRYIRIDDETAEALAIHESDFFVSRGNGSLQLLGRGTLAQAPEERIVFPDTMIRLRLAQVNCLARFVSLIWDSRLMRRQIEGKARTTAGIYKISQADLEAFAVPVPPPAEQQQIVAEVERHLSIVDELEAQVEANLKRAARLRQSILQRAFEGRLVPQDPRDEPASLLLKQIEQEKARTTVAGRDTIQKVISAPSKQAKGT